MYDWTATFNDSDDSDDGDDVLLAQSGMYDEADGFNDDLTLGEEYDADDALQHSDAAKRDDSFLYGLLGVK